MAPSVSTSSERLALANPTRPSFAPHQHAHPRRYSRWSRHVSKLQPTLYRSLLSRALLLQKYGQRVHRLALRIRFSDVRYPGHLARIKALYGDLVASGFSELGRNHRIPHDRRQSLGVAASSRSSSNQFLRAGSWGLSRNARMSNGGWPSGIFLRRVPSRE